MSLVCILLFIFWSRKSVLNYFFGWLSHIPYIGSYGEKVFLIFIIVCILASLKLITSKIRKNDIIFVLIFASLYIVSFLYSGNAVFLTKHMPILAFEVLPAYFLGLTINLNFYFKFLSFKKSVFDWLYFLSILSILTAMLYYIYFISTRTAGTDVGEWSTILIPSTIMCICFSFRKKNKFIPVLFTLFAISLLLIYGTRMALVCAFVGFIFYLFKYNKRTTGIILLFSFCFFVIFQDYIFQGVTQLKTLFINYHLNTRILDFMLSNDLHIEARNEFFQNSLVFIGRQPIIGYGLMGDRVLFGGYQEYAHNLFLEIFLDFGIFIGTFVLLVIGYTLVKGFHSMKNDADTRDLFILLFSYEIVNLMMSGSYLSDKFLFLLFGICVNAIRRKKESI